MNIQNLSLEKQLTLCAILDGGKLIQNAFSKFEGSIFLPFDQNNYFGWESKNTKYHLERKLKYNKSLDWLFRLIVQVDCIKDVGIKFLTLASGSTTILTSIQGNFTNPCESNTFKELGVESLCGEMFKSFIGFLNDNQGNVENFIGMTIDSLEGLD